jgi:trimeric autotransporter adhesin
MHDDTDTEASSVHSSSASSSKPAITVSSATAATAAAAASATAATVAAAVAAAAAVARLSEQQAQQQPAVSSNPASDADDDNSDSSEDEPAAALGRIASKIRNYTPFSAEASLPAADAATTTAATAASAADRKRRRAAAAAAAAATKSNSSSSRSLASTAPASVRSLVGGPASPPLGSGAARPGPVSVRGAGGIGSASRPAFRSSGTATSSQSCVDVKSSGRGLFNGSGSSSGNVSSTTADGRSHTPLGMGKPRSGAVSVRDMVMRGGPPLSPPESTTHAGSKQQQQSQAWAVRT